MLCSKILLKKLIKFPGSLAAANRRKAEKAEKKGHLHERFHRRQWDVREQNIEMGDKNYVTSLFFFSFECLFINMYIDFCFC